MSTGNKILINPIHTLYIKIKSMIDNIEYRGTENLVYKVHPLYLDKYEKDIKTMIEDINNLHIKIQSSIYEYDIKIHTLIASGLKALLAMHWIIKAQEEIDEVGFDLYPNEWTVQHMIGFQDIKSNSFPELRLELLKIGKDYLILIDELKENI